MGNYRRIDRRLLWAIAIAGLLFVLYFRLVPFSVDFSSGLAAIPARFTWQPLSLKDIPFNLLIFIPFSFGLAGLLYQSGRSWSRVSWLTVLCVMAISALIELVQVYIPERVPSVTDILTNGLSALLGVFSYRLVAFGIRRSIVRHATPAHVALGLLAYGLLVGLLTAYLVWSVGLSNWDTRLPMTLGNENTDFRPWEGEIGVLALLNRAVTAQEAAEWLTGALPESALAHYDLTGTAPFADQQSTLPPLNWLPDTLEPPPASPGGAAVGSDQWLSTGESVAAFNEQAQAASAFTIAADLMAARQRQRGPARIISISSDSGNRNITLGQQGDALSIRLRTPSSGVNGERPEMLVPGFFVPSEPQRIVMTYDSPELVLYHGASGAPDTLSVSMAPGLALFQDFADSNRWLLPFPDNPQHYNYLYWAIMVLPALLAAVLLLGIRYAVLAANKGT